MRGPALVAAIVVVLLLVLGWLISAGRTARRAARHEPTWARGVSWGILCVGFAVPLAGYLMFLSDSRIAGVGVAVLATSVGWVGIKRGWNTRKVLNWGWLAGSIFAVTLLVMMANASAARIRPSSADKFVLNNARQLAAGAEEYYQEHGVTSVRLENLVGLTNYVKALNTVASENYPDHFTKGVPITVTGIGGLRTVTYAP